MTAEEILDKYYYGRNNQSTDPATNILNAMKAFAQDMCEKQREICAENADMDSGGSYDSTQYWINKDTIINSPLPEELQ